MSSQTLLRQASGTTLVLSPGDRIVTEITLACSSGRCASRHGQEKPVEFTFTNADPFPEAGDQFLSLILPERSPSNPGTALPFCGPSCLRDWLLYEYQVPVSRAAEAAKQPEPQPLAVSQADGCSDPADVHGA